MQEIELDKSTQIQGQYFINTFFCCFHFALTNQSFMKISTCSLSGKMFCENWIHHIFFFVSVSKNHNAFNSTIEERSSLIYNHDPVYVGVDHKNYAFEQFYAFMASDEVMSKDVVV